MRIMLESGGAVMPNDFLSADWEKQLAKAKRSKKHDQGTTKKRGRPPSR